MKNEKNISDVEMIANKLGLEVGQKVVTTKADATVKDALAGRYDIAGLNALLKKLDTLILDAKATKYEIPGIIKLFLHQDLGEKKGQIKVAMLDSERLFKVQTGQSCYPKGGFKFEIETSKNGFRTALSGKMNITLEFYDLQGNHIRTFGLNSVMYPVQSKDVEITIAKVKKPVNQFEAFTQARVLELVLELQTWQSFEVQKTEGDTRAKAEKEYRKLGKTATLDQLKEFAENFEGTQFATVAAERAAKLEKSETTPETLQA